MKSYLKRVGLLVLVLALMLGLTACGGVKGKYHAYEIDDKPVRDFFKDLGMELSKREAKKMVILELKANDECVIEFNRDTGAMSLSGTYTVDGDTVVFNITGNQIKGTFIKGKITVELFGNKYKFKK